jgi:hypothetical protein
VLSGCFHYGTAFGEPSGLADTVEAMSSVLVGKGFSYCGKDFLTSGITGVLCHMLFIACYVEVMCEVCSCVCSTLYQVCMYGFFVLLALCHLNSNKATMCIATLYNLASKPL